MSQNLSLAKNPIIDRIGADQIHWQIQYRILRKKPRKEEESLRQELGKQARRRGVKGEARGEHLYHIAPGQQPRCGGASHFPLARQAYPL